VLHALSCSRYEVISAFAMSGVIVLYGREVCRLATSL
jgi:hypothetical protein